MRCIIDTNIDPYWNLAAEEFLFKQCGESIFRLWQNDNAVIVGRYQNTLAEINLDYVKENNISVVRRLTGGGAVYHDMGNVNFTFIDKKTDGEDSAAMFRRFTKPIIDILNELGVKAYLEGRNDLLIDGKKFSGNALATYKDRVLQHGTLLFSSSKRDISGALASRPEKYSDRRVKSNPRRITNISEYLPKTTADAALSTAVDNPMTINQFIDYIKDYIVRSSDSISRYSEEEFKAITKLADEKYRLDSWNLGNSPTYQFKTIHKFPVGLIEVMLNVEKGIINEVKIFGDYFFLKPTEEIEDLLRGVPHSKENIFIALRETDLTKYFGDINLSDFINSLF